MSRRVLVAVLSIMSAAGLASAVGAQEAKDEREPFLDATWVADALAFDPFQPLASSAESTSVASAPDRTEDIPPRVFIGRPPIRIPYRPVLRSPFRPPLL